MPLILLYVIALTLICFISIILTEMPPQIHANASSDDEQNSLPPTQTLEQFQTKITLMDDPADVSTSVDALTDALEQAQKLAEEKAEKPYYYF